MDEQEDIDISKKDPEFIENTFSFVFGILSAYGWFIFGISLLAYFLWRQYSTKLEEWKDSSERHRNPDKFIEREVHVATVRQNLQEKYDAASAEHAAKQKEMEEKRRELAREKLLKGEPVNEPEEPKPKKPLKPLRPEYNPLLGDTSSCSFSGGGGRRRTGGG